MIRPMCEERERLVVTEQMVKAGVWEIYARLPDVVFVMGDAEQLVRDIWAAMLTEQQGRAESP